MQTTIITEKNYSDILKKLEEIKISASLGKQLEVESACLDIQDILVYEVKNIETTSFIENRSND